MESTEIGKQVDAIIQEMSMVVIDNDDTFVRMAEGSKRIKAITKEVEAFYQEELDAAKSEKAEAEKKLRAVKDKIEVYTNRLDGADRLLKKKLGDYHAEKERLRLEAQRKADEEAREIARKAQAQRDEMLLRSAIETGNEKILEQAKEEVKIRPAVVAPMAPKVSGVTFRKRWKYRVVDEGKLPREFLVPNHDKLGQIARDLKEDAKVDGVEFYAETEVAR